MRCLNVLRFLARRAMTRRELASLIGINERSIRRYIYACQRAGIDIETFVSEDIGNPTMYALRPMTWAALIAIEPEPEVRKPRHEMRRQ